MERECDRGGVEGLLLLIDLTFQNNDIQKIVAFNNAFERLFQIIHLEGGSDGDVIVQDCLHLIENLLLDNISNHNYFRESGLISQFPQLLSVASADGQVGRSPGSAEVRL